MLSKNTKNYIWLCALARIAKYIYRPFPINYWWCLFFLFSCNCLSAQNHLESRFPYIEKALNEERYATAYVECNKLLKKENLQFHNRERWKLYLLYFESLDKIVQQSRTLNEGLIEMDFQHFEDAIKLAYDLQDSTLLEDVLRFMELVKNVFLQKRLDGAWELESLKMEREQLIEKYKQSNDLSLVGEIKKLESKINDLSSSEENYFPEYSYLPISLYKLRKTMLSDEACVNYFVGDSLVFSLVVTSEKNILNELGSVNEIGALVEQYHQNVHHRYRREKLARLSHALYKKLFEPVRACLNNGHKKITIIPDDFISFISFDALVSTDLENWDRSPNTLKRLITEGYQFTYRHSVTTVPEGRISKAIINIPPKFLGLAPVLDNTLKARLPKDTLAEQLAVLSETESFMHGLERVMKGTYLYRQNANTSQFLRHISQADIVHLATHTLVDKSNFTQSSIVLSPSNSNQPTLDYLSIKKLFSLKRKLKPDLLVLAGCETGRGRIRRGESIAGPAFAFHMLGVPNLIYSLWPVDELATCRLFELFYHRLKEGRSKAEALHLAKLELMQQRIFSAPFFWSGFVLFGDNKGYEFE